MESIVYASYFIMGIILGVIATLAIIFKCGRKRIKKYYIKREPIRDYKFNLYEYDMNTGDKKLICEKEHLVLYGIHLGDFQDLKPGETREVFLNLED